MSDLTGLRDYAALETALRTWAAGATGVPLTRVIARNAKVTQPDHPYVTVDLPAAGVVDGGPDDTYATTDLTQPVGAEVGLTTRGHREAVVQVEVFTRATAGGVDTYGALPARAYLARLALAVHAPVQRAVLTAAGLVPIAVEAALDLTERLGPAGQGRARFELRCRFAETWTDRTGYIATADVTGTVG